MSGDAADATLSVLYINKHNHSVAHLDGLGGQGQEAFSDCSALPGAGQQALDSMSAEDLARAMYTDLMLQLSETRRAEVHQSTALTATSAGVDSGENLPPDAWMDEDRRLVSEAEELLSALLEASSDVVVAPAASGEPGVAQGSRARASLLATSSSDALGPGSPQPVASSTPLLLEPCTDPSVFPGAPSVEPRSFVPCTVDSAPLAPNGDDPTLLMPHLAEEASRHFLTPPLLPAPHLSLPHPRQGGTEGSSWAEGMGCSAIQGEAKLSGGWGSVAAQQRRKAGSPPQASPRGLIVDWDVAQLLESVMGPPTARSESNWSPREWRTQDTAGPGDNMA